MGAWAPYADNSVDTSPLGDTTNHVLASENASVQPVATPLQELKTIANLRFKGTKDGAYKSEKLFDDDEGSKPKRWHGDDDDEAEENPTTSEFTSIAPLQHVSFVLKEPIEKSGDESAIKITLAGSDVYAGLHELSVATADENEMVLDPRSIPNWLTGT
jgi:central kinetochore subunit Mis15/CHL4